MIRFLSLATLLGLIVAVPAHAQLSVDVTDDRGRSEEHTSELQSH